jgi:hypothetical protein
VKICENRKMLVTENNASKSNSDASNSNSDASNWKKVNVFLNVVWNPVIKYLLIVMII